MKQLIFLFLFLCTKLFGQTGYPDSTFNYEKREKFGDGYGFNMSNLNDLDFTNNNKMLFSGNFSDYGGWVVNGLARLNSDRSIDKTFQANFNVDCWIRQSEILSDQKIIAAGSFSSVGGQLINGIVRLNADGTVDNSFLIGSGINSGGLVYSFLIDANDKIVLVGNFTSINGISCQNIARLNSDGTVDLTFDTALGTDGIILTVGEFSNGNYAIGGAFTTYNGISRNKIAVVLPNGSLDMAFDIQGGFSGEVHCLDIQLDQKVLLVGSISSFNNSVTINKIARVNTDGSLDLTFSNNNLVNAPNWVEERPDGTILVAGVTDYYDANGFYATGLMVANADGSVTQLVETNAINANFPTGFSISKIIISPSNEIYAVGYVDFSSSFSPYSGVIKFNGSTYEYIPEVSIATGSNNPFEDGLVQYDGKIVCVGGYFQDYNGVSKRGVVRVNQNGSLDSTFLSGSGIEIVSGTENVTSLEQQLDGKLIVGGNFDNYNGMSLHAPIRLNVDGTLDGTFNAGSGVNERIYDMAIQPDGKIILVGYFNVYNDNYIYNKICRINSDGSYDPTFSTQFQSDFNSEWRSVEILDNGQIVVGGYTGSNYNALIRLNSDGTVDNSFVYPIAVGNYVTEIEVLADGKLIVLTGNGIKRVNTDGTLDNSFIVTGLPSNGDLTSICLRSDGTIVTPKGIINSDGTFQNSNLFSNSTHWYDVNKIRLANDGRIYFFTEHYTHPNLPMYNGIVRLIDNIPGVNGLEVYFNNINDVTCSDSGAVHADAMFGQAPYTFEWLMNGDNNQYFVPGEPGFYGCAVVDDLGSSDTSYLYVDGPILMNEIDLRATLHSNEFRPGFEGTLWINASNEGCFLTDGVLTLVVDTLLDSISSVPAPTSISGDTLTWNYAAINSDFGFVNIQIDYFVPVYAQIGDSVSFELKFSTNDSDIDLTNNVENHKIPIVNGYDPNYISAYPYGLCEELYIDSNQIMTYTIHFQNTGNSEAIHIKVLNELNGPLNLSSLRLLGSSSQVWVELIDNTKLMFHFDNIHLIDSIHDEPNSHGYVTYSLRSDYNSFGIIENNAKIFFDYNPPIVTNTVTNTVYNGTVSPETCYLALNEYEISDNNISVYPNPFYTEINIEYEEKEIHSYVITDLNGSVILKGSLDNSKKTIDLYQLESGLFLMKFMNGQGLIKETKKIVKL
jgi:uncharacterized delta-60 repeat protein